MYWACLNVSSRASFSLYFTYILVLDVRLTTIHFAPFPHPTCSRVQMSSWQLLPYKIYWMTLTRPSFLLDTDTDTKTATTYVSVSLLAPSFSNHVKPRSGQLSR